MEPARTRPSRPELTLLEHVWRFEFVVPASAGQAPDKPNRQAVSNAPPAEAGTTNSSRHRCCAFSTTLLVICLLLATGLAQSSADGATNLSPVHPEIRLSGRLAPAPSSAVCGFSLVAHDTGPQICFTEKPSTAVVALQPGENVTWTSPLVASPGKITVSAEASPLEPCEAEVALTVNGTNSCRLGLHGDSVTLSVTLSSSARDLTLQLESSAGSKPAAIRWRNVRLLHEKGESVIALSPGRSDVDLCPPRVLPALRPSIEQALIEWDWRMQDGIETDRVPVSYAAAVEKLLDRGDALVRDFEARGMGQSVVQIRWESVRMAWRQLIALREANESLWEDLWRRAHQVRREIALSNPLMAGRPILFIKQAPSIFSHQLTQYYGSCARPGGGVFLLERPGRSMACRPLTADLPMGSVQHLEVSPGADRLLFAFCAAPDTPKNREEHLARFYHLYEMDVQGRRIKPLTDGPFDDFAPRYLPDGGLVFISTRRGGYHRCGRGPCAVYTLCTAHGDGSDPRPISWHETHEWDPVILRDGRILYTRWDYVDRDAVHYQQLWSARPDGSGVRIFYGNNTFSPVGIWEAQLVPGSDRVMATAAAHHAMTAGSIILLDTSAEVDGPGPITRLTPDALFPESEAPVVQKPSGAWSAPVGRVESVVAPPEARRWPGHCYRTPCPLAEQYFLAAYSFDALVGEPTWNPANMFGLYLVDAFGNKELLYRDLNISSLWPRLLQPAPTAPRIVGGQEGTGKEGAFLLLNVRTAWPALPAEKITALRILQVLPKSTPHANTPAVGLANASPGKQVLGTVPVESDGSAYFRAPAGIPLAFQALDELGRAVQTMRSVVYLQPGEVQACVGCHESRTTAPAQAQPALALQRPPSAISPGPEGSKPLSYPRLVQPVLDQHCAPCHGSSKAEGKIVLTGEAQGHYTVSYNTLAPRVSFSAWGGKPGDFRLVNSEPVSQPGFFGARGSPLMQKLLAGHSKVKLTPDGIERLVTWMDANALFYGTFDPEDQTRQLHGEAIAGPKIE